MPFMIAIDGPAGAGKSTVARQVAAVLGLTYIDTGAMYRALAWKALRMGCDLTNAVELAQIAINTTIRFSALDTDLQQQVWVDAENVTAAIRTPEVSNLTSAISVFPAVRKIIVECQRRLGEANTQGVVLEGRDIGTVVFPQATLKIFLTASPEERARRRYQELQAKGIDIDFGRILADQQERDKRDSERVDSPLAAAEDAILLNTDAMAIHEVVQNIIALARTKKLAS